MDRAFGIEVVDSSPGVRTDLPEISRETLRPLCQKKDVGSNRLHEDAITNGWARGRRCATRVHQRRQPIASVYRWAYLGLLIGIRPSSAVEVAQRNSTPLQVVTALQVVLDLDVHDDSAGLLNLTNAAELHAIGEAGGNIARRSVSAQVL